jgi:hypothetical protein
MKYSLLISLVCLMTASCLDSVEDDPPCFLDGKDDNENTAEVSINICCTQDSEGDTSCRDLFANEGYREISQMAYCTETGYCKLCEIDVDCACLSNRDCGPDQRCLISDDPNQCSDQLDMDSSSQRCALCL